MTGGHTAEMKSLVSSLNFERYTPRTYVYCHGDEMSVRVITELENSSEHSVCFPSRKIRRNTHV
jgi:beta-1,4-N-acetylglucosaminyltransferase